MTYIDNTTDNLPLGVIATVAFIQEAHKDQMYGVMPYFFHPVEVAETVTSLEYPINGRLRILAYIVALLHDVIEDTKYTKDMLLTRYSNDVVDAVVLLSHDTDLPYLENIQRIIDSGNIIAMLVKLADNTVNRNGDKSSFNPVKAKRLNDRYDASIKLLTTALARLKLEDFQAYERM